MSSGKAEIIEEGQIDNRSGFSLSKLFVEKYALKSLNNNREGVYFFVKLHKSYSL